MLVTIKYRRIAFERAPFGRGGRREESVVSEHPKPLAKMRLGGGGDSKGERASEADGWVAFRVVVGGRNGRALHTAQVSRAPVRRSENKSRNM